jgi:hypothetical protein
MKTLATDLLTEQKKFSVTPAVKIGIQSYGFPAESSKIVFNEYGWTSVLETSKGAAAACCASDGSFVITSGTGATTVRIAPTIDLDTVFTVWGAAGTKGTFAAGNTFCIAANPTSDEVIIAYLSAGHLYRIESTNYGASFGSATNMGASSGTVVRMAYTPTGDLTILTAYMYAECHGSFVDINRYWIKLIPYIRRLNSWITGSTSSTELTELKFPLGWGSYPSATGYPPGGPGSAGYSSGGRMTTVPIVLNGADIAYDGDWFIIYTCSQTQSGSTGGQGRPISLGSITYGLYGVTLGNGTNATPNSWTNNAEITLVDTKVNINSLSQLSHFSPSPPTGQKIAYETATMPILLTQPELLRTATIHPAAYLHKISGYPLILSLWSEGRVYLCELKRGTNITTATFDKAYTFYNDRPVKLASNSTWLFAYNGDQIFMSPLPGDWVVPTGGTGAGSEYNIVTSGVVGIQVYAPNQSHKLILTFSNNSGEFNALGSGSLSGLARGSRIDLYLGYLIGSTETTSEIQRFFVDGWSYSRKPNYAMFTLKCDDAWALLDKYKFNRSAKFNYLGAITTYNVYQIIEMLANTIGGTLTYESRSTDIVTMTPNVNAHMGDSAGDLMRRLLNLVPDVIKWFGNDATILNPQTTDSVSYYYKGT